MQAFWQGRLDDFWEGCMEIKERVFKFRKFKNYEIFLTYFSDAFWMKKL